MIYKTWNRINNAWRAARDFGFRWTLARLYYEWNLRTGIYQRKFPMRSWHPDEAARWLKEDIPSHRIREAWRENQPAFFFSVAEKDNIAEAIRRITPQAAESVAEVDIHRPRYFTWLPFDVTYPDIWFTNPFCQPPVKLDSDRHWSAYPMYSEAYEDLKFVWEPGRFSIVYDLVRSYILTGNESAAGDFWQLVESWIDHNPPNTGPHWKCGQETSLRLMAWYVGLFAFLDSPQTTPQRFTKLLGAAAAQADRVSKDLQYSYLQHSNHAVSEGLGLYTTGLLFPQLKQADDWKKRGKEILEERAFFLIRPDGTALQKSHNYLRFILHAYLYVLALGEANGDRFSDPFKERLAAALDYLRAVIDPVSGRVPNYGSNDGALILPLNSCDFTDYRPVVAVLHFYLHRELLFEPGPWHEDIIWLFGPDAIQQAPTAVPAPIPSRSFDTGGIYTLRDRRSWMFMHAESYQDRPAHADALHVDLWWQGINLCSDPGTYLYYGHPPWQDAFKHSHVHNTIVIDDQDQMERTYRFTWAYWHQCRLLHQWQEGPIQGITVEHDGYHRLSDPVTHRRSVISLGDDCWLVIDDLLGKETHEAVLQWLLPDVTYAAERYQKGNDGPVGRLTTLQLSAGDYEVGVFSNSRTADEFNLFTGDRQSEDRRGLAANYYARLDTAISLQYTITDTLPLRFISCFGPAGWKFEGSAALREIVIRTSSRSIQLDLGEVGGEKKVQTTQNKL